LRPLADFIGNSAAMQAIKNSARLVAARDTTVMLQGEIGSGKEMLARYVHSHSKRVGRPFIPIDYSAASALSAPVGASSRDPCSRATP